MKNSKISFLLKFIRPKQLFSVLALFATLFVMSGCEKETLDGGGGYSAYEVTFWSDFSGAPISVYFNGSYQGKITSVLNSPPRSWPVRMRNGSIFVIWFF
jgi:hypothetical protein